MGKRPSRHPSCHQRGLRRDQNARVARAWKQIAGVLLLPASLVLLAACGSDPGDPSSPKGSAVDAELTVNGVATAPMTDPTATPTEIPFSGTLECTRDGAAEGTVMYAANAAPTCRQLARRSRVFADFAPDDGRICPEVYGGPQRARITGTVDGTPVDVELTRSDGCGIEFWTALEWLLGPPER